MARTRMITRTITETIVTAMCVNVVVGEVNIVSYTISGEFKTNDEILKVLKKRYEDDTFKVVNIQNVETVEKLYGMPEEDFIRLATELPPRDTK